MIILIVSFDQVKAQDTIVFPLRISAGLEVSGPLIYFYGKDIRNYEAYASADINEKTAIVLGGGSTNYNYSQYNYEYKNTGIFLKAGPDFNLLKPDKGLGRFWLGIGLRYGLSHFTSEVPSFHTSNYWGITTSSIEQKKDFAHFFEFSPGVRAEVIKNLTVGWTLSFKMLLHNSAGHDLRPIYVPGFGNSATKFTNGISYFIVWNISYKKKKVIIEKEVPEETDDTDTTVNEQQATGQQ